MIFLEYSIFLIIFAGFSCYYTEHSNQFKNFILTMDNKKEDSLSNERNVRCPVICSNNLNNTVAVHTALNHSLNMHVQASDFVTAMVYYKCTNFITTPVTGRYQHHVFQKLCDNRTDICEEFAGSYNSSWVSRSEGITQVFNVDIRLPHHVSDLRIRTQSCVKRDLLIFEFRIDSEPIKYDYKNYEYEKDIFLARNLEKSPIKLVMTKFQGAHVADIIFNISKSKCLFGMHEVSSNDLGYRCFMTVNDRLIEGGYPALPCGKQDVTVVTQLGTDVCHSFSRPMCARDCYNMPHCSYMCVVQKEGLLEEGGYLMGNYSESYPDFIGSGSWNKSNLPVEYVLLDECSYDIELCGLGGRCKDEPTAFLCAKGTLDTKTCLDSQATSPYWQCPANVEAISEAIRAPMLLHNRTYSMYLKKEIMNTFRGKVTTKLALQAMFDVFSYLFSKGSNTSVNLPASEKRKLANFLLKGFVKSFSEYSETQKEKAFANDSFNYYREEIEDGKNNVVIPMSGDTEKERKEFIKFELQQPKTRTRRRLVANYFRFKNMDIMNESAAIKGKVKNIKVLKDSEISPDGYDDEKGVLYRNSEMFTLSVDGGSHVKSVKYKLQTFEKVEPYSWLYEAKHACGFLDEEKDWQWSKKGCVFVTNGTESYCECDHLSNFAMLFSMKEVNKHHLKAFEALSLVGGIVNAVSLSLFVVFVLFINSRDKLRIDQLNIAICLLLGTIIFLCGALFSKNAKLCSVAALVNQFLFLSAFVWKLILGINVVRLIASLRYQNEDWMVKYRWIMLSAGYSLPLLIVIISGSINWPDYGEVSENVCWIQAKSGAFLSFIIPVGIIIAVNTIGLFFIANTLIRNYINTHKTRMNESNEAVVFIQLLVSMGLTWLPAYFATQYVSAMYIFVVFFPIQGLMMFLLVVVINKENREKVSSFFLNSYYSMTSKSTSITDGKSTSKSKSTNHSKGTEESEDLLVMHPKEDKSEYKFTVPLDELPKDGCVTTC